MRALHRPRRLVPGDRVAVVSPAGPSSAADLEAGLGVLRSWGLEPVLMPHAARTGAYLAGTDAERAEDFTAAWTDPSFAAVIAARGGYGAQRMLDRIDWVRLRGAEPKAFVGFSDVTALHEAIALNLGTATIHGPMPAWPAFVTDTAMREHLRLTLFEPERVLTLAPAGAKALAGGTATGVTVGGTLTLLAAGIGTAEHRVDLAGALLLLEDVGEAPYRLDRALTQLRRAGWFDGIAGVVLGSWTDCGPEAEVRGVFEDLLGGLGVPVAWNFGFGHCPQSLSVPLGLKATLDADAGTLRFALPALR
ncbi:S66 peptidase family protein [Glycomyces albidus]|uniref:S66 peptidase family protein n=1 Tax=Glycomyces albidus TaxID=2656774 RepID=UPI002AD238FC|nr:LD-carboxypeptidase [Glycomyces albidus]